MGEGPVGLCHPMRVFLTLHARADVVLGVQDLPASLRPMVFSRLARAKPTIQRRASVFALRASTSTGTW